MKVAPISYSIFHIKENKGNKKVVKPTNPIISDVPNFYVPTVISFKRRVNLGPDRTLENAGDDVKGFIEDFIDEFDVDQSKVEKAVKKVPDVITQGFDKTKEKIEDIAKRFKDEGLEEKDYAQACIRQPSLFLFRSDTIEKNVRDLVKKFENEGLTTKEYLKSCIGQPCLFFQSPDTIEKNVRDLVKKFENDGLTTKEYLKSCVRQSSLFSQSPDTLESNVRNLVKKFENEGLTTKDYLKACVRQPSLFCQSPDTVGEHIDVLKFSRTNAEVDINDDNFFDKILAKPIDFTKSSSLLMIEYLIIPKMFKEGKIPRELKGAHLRENLNNYLKSHPERSFTLNVKPIETNTDCFKILNETIRKIEEDAGCENIFEINVQG